MTQYQIDQIRERATAIYEAHKNDPIAAGGDVISEEWIIQLCDELDSRKADYELGKAMRRLMIEENRRNGIIQIGV